MNDKINPCTEYCFNRYGKEYSSECDTECEYASEVRKRKLLEQQTVIDLPLPINCYNCVFKQQNISAVGEDDKYMCALMYVKRADRVNIGFCRQFRHPDCPLKLGSDILEDANLL